MRKQQLYINGIAVDMPAEDIKIKVESNLFSDASKLMTAHSYSITLPRTITNDSIFALAYIPSSNTGGVSTHRYLPCSLYYDGIPLFERGQCVLASVEDNGYKCNLFWGLLNIFEEIKREGLDLCDLPASAYWDESISRWLYLDVYDDQLPQYISGMTTEIFNTLDSDSKDLARNTPWILPSVPASRVLSDALSVYGLSFDTTIEANARLNTLWHPLTSRKATAKGESVTINGVVQMRNMGSGKYEPCFIDPIDDSQHPFNIEWAVLSLPDAPPTLNHSATNSYIANDCVTIKIGNTYEKVASMVANCDIKVTRVRIFGALPYPSIIYIPNLNDMRIAPVYDGGSPQPQTYDVEINESFSVQSGEEILHLADEWESPASSFSAGILNVQITIEDATGVQVYRPWDFVRNYPNVGVINYISEILAHIGGCVVGNVTTPNQLRIATLDEIVATPPTSLDILGVKAITMSFDNLAQKNIYKHKENDDAHTADEAEGIIYTSDSTLALDRIAFDSKFKVPVLGKVLLWEVDGDKASWNNAGDYIAGYVSDAGTIVNTGQDFMNTIANYYTSYEDITKYPKIIQVIVRLPILDLINFDFAKPVYIKQLNRSYLVKTLETESGEQYKLTLVQI